MRETKAGRFSGVQALRALASLAVFLQHLIFYVCNNKGQDWRPILRIDIGSLGVGIFFVISGFVIAPRVRQEGKTYFIRRLLRIYPPYWMAVLVSYWVLSLCMGQAWHADAKSLALVPVRLEDMNNSYHIPYWTLIYEVFFYLSFGCAAHAVQRKNLSHALLAWLAAIAFYGIYSEMNVAAPAGLIAFSPMNSLFIVGALLGLNQDTLIRPELSAAYLAAALFLWVASVSIPMRHAVCGHLLAGLCFACVIAFSTTVEPPKGLARLGDYSYGIYLTHVVFITAAISIGDTLNLGFAPALGFVFGMAILPAMAFGAMEYHFHRIVSSRLGDWLSAKTSRSGLE